MSGDASSTRLSVFTLARDDISGHEREHTATTVHWIDANTDFRRIFEAPGAAGFFANNLPALHDYQNTSFEVTGQPPQGALQRRLYWPLPYKSTIVAPIFSFDRESNESDRRGFLAVDSSTVRAFSKRYDKSRVQTAARMLFPLVRKWHELKEA